MEMHTAAPHPTNTFSQQKYVELSVTHMCLYQTSFQHTCNVLKPYVSSPLLRDEPHVPSVYVNLPHMKYM